MARVANLHEDDETQLNQEPGQDYGGAQSVAQSAGTATAAAPAPRQGRFRDINRLLYANQGQGQAVAQQAIGAAEGKVNVAKSQLAGATGAYQAQAQAAVPQQQVVRAQSAPPLVQGAGPGSGEEYVAPGRNVPGGALQRGSRATTQVNIAEPPTPDYAALEQQAAATYGGPRSFNETKGVDQAALQGAFTDAQRAASSLTQPAGVSALLGRTGGAGAFDNLLAQHEAGGALRAAGGRLGGIRSMLDAAVKDTSASDRARGATEGVAASARGALADRDRRIQDTMNRQTQSDNAAEAQRQADEADFETFVTKGLPSTFVMGPQGLPQAGAPTGFASDEDRRTYFDNNKDVIREWMRTRGMI